MKMKKRNIISKNESKKWRKYATSSQYNPYEIKYREETEG
jgi:hypothetical protein